jgi:hypothetical protein
MTKISDADLMAYADGVLPRHLRPLVRQALLRDPALLEKLESYIITNRGLAAPFDRLPPVPDRLRRLLAPENHGPSERWWFMLMRSVGEVRLADRWRLPAWSLAGLAALVCATVLAWHLSTTNASGPQLAELEAKGMLLPGQFQRALEHTESNVTTQLTSLKPTGTFFGRQNEWCRQYELTRGKEARLAGIACRDASGDWQVKGWARLDPVVRPQDGSYAPAGQETSEGKDGLGNLEITLGKLMRDVVLLPSDEKRLIADGWQLPR